MEFYSLYKQATAGDCNIAKPAGSNAEAYIRKGMSKQAAEAAYMAAYKKYAADYA